MEPRDVSTRIDARDAGLTGTTVRSLPMLDLPAGFETTAGQGA